MMTMTMMMMMMFMMPMMAIVIVTKPSLPRQEYLTTRGLEVDTTKFFLPGSKETNSRQTYSHEMLLRMAIKKTRGRG